MRSALSLCVFFSTALLFSAASRSDVTPSLPPAPAAAEPITGTAIDPAPNPNAQPPRDPFAPYDIGPASWSYEQLTAAERVVADRGRDTNAWTKIHDAFAAASAERAQLAAGESAEHQLGVDNLAATGVVP